MTINNRIELIIKALGLNNNSFSIAIGVNPTVSHNIVKGRNAPSFELMNKIALSFDNIDMNWLITGEGEMLRHINKDGLPQVCTQTSGDPPECARCKDKDAVIAAQRAQIESQTELLDLLKQARPSTNDGQKRKTA